jgi:HAD superfamily hydrolase (TIGR01549 family)
MGIPIEKSFRTFGAENFSDEQFADLLVLFRRHYAGLSETHIEAFPGVAEALLRLKAAGVKVAIATSKHATVAQKNLSQLGLAAAIDVVIGSNSVSNYKPHPEPLLKALEGLSIPPTNGVAMIGDATVDIEMGRAAGVSTYAVTWGAHSIDQLRTANPNYIVETVPELVEVLLSNLL